LCHSDSRAKIGSTENLSGGFFRSDYAISCCVGDSAIVLHLVSLDLPSSFTDSDKTRSLLSGSSSVDFLCKLLNNYPIPQDNVLLPKIWNQTKVHYLTDS
ncbi:unnamed protein product, partial [Brassica rapa subsp. trilocularis]